jgi:TonB family protein
MPGEAAIAFSYSKPGPFEERLRVDDHKNLLHSLGVGYIVGAACLSYALTVKLSFRVYQPPADPPGRGFTVIPPKDYHGKMAKAPLLPAHANPHHENAPPPLTRHPSKVAGVMRQNVINANSDRSDYLANELVKNFLHGLDQDKLEKTSVLSRTEETRLAGRKGILRDTFNGDYNLYGKKDGENLIPEVPAATDRIRSSPRGSPSLATSSQIEMAFEGRMRSSESIMATIRAHSPGLRHVYNTFLKLRPGLSGKVTVRFAVAPRGDVVDAAVVSSTMNLSEFDRQLLASVLAWRFEPVKSLGNDIVTVPFTFSE